jgi:hypothetical protein
MVSRPTAEGARRYVCASGPNFTGCGHTYIRADPLEAFLVEAVLYRLDTPELAAALRGDAGDPDAERLQAEVDAEQALLEELAGAYAARQIALSEWLTARAPIEQRLTAARRKLARVSRTSVLDGFVGDGAGLRARWSSLSLTRQRAIVAAVLDHVVVGSGRPGYNRFDPARLRPVWRV